MNSTFSWLYGPSQPQECGTCGTPVQAGPANLLEHHKYWCERDSLSQALVVTR